MSRVKKSEKKATVERRVQSTSKKVKMNQPCRYCEQVPGGGLGMRLTIRYKPNSS